MLMTLQSAKEKRVPSHFMGSYAWIIQSRFQNSDVLESFPTLHIQNDLLKFEFPLWSINSDFYCVEPFEKLSTTLEKNVQHFLRVSSIRRARSPPIDAYELHSGYAAVCFIQS